MIRVGFFLLLLTSISCKFGNNKRQELIAEKVKENTTAYQQQKRETCLKDAFEVANKKVDSMLLEEARAASVFQVDSVYVEGYRPLKPAKPAIKEPKDTERVSRLFDIK